MPDLAFYHHAGLDGLSGPKRLIGPSRRLLRKLLLPMFRRLEQILASLCDRLDAAEAAAARQSEGLTNLAQRHDELAEQMQAALAFGWDYVALTRRLGALEDEVERLSARLDGAGAGASPRAKAG